jgi:hypothetical protein
MMKNNYLNKIYFYIKEMKSDPKFITCNSYNKSRFCYSYTPPGNIDNCCIQPVCATNAHIALISSLPMVTNNSTRTTERSLLLSLQQQYSEEINATQVSTVVSSTIANSVNIANIIYGQLQQIKKERYEPYQPYIPPTMPQSVIDLQMNTRNAGVPHSFFTVADCKGVQSVTT